MAVGGKTLHARPSCKSTLTNPDLEVDGERQVSPSHILNTQFARTPPALFNCVIACYGLAAGGRYQASKLEGRARNRAQVNII